MSPELILLIVGCLVFIGFAGSLLLTYKKIPDILILVTVGFFLGPLTKIVDPGYLEPAKEFFGELALLIIMFEGGLALSFTAMVTYIAQTSLVSLISYLLTSGAIFALSFFVWGFSTYSALMIAFMFANISGAIVIPIVAKLTEKESTKIILSLESAITDIITVVGVIVILAIATGKKTELTFSDVFNKFAGQFSIAIVIGVISGLLWIKFLEYTAGSPLSYMTTLGAALLVYSITKFAQGSGPMSVLVFGVVLKNGERFLQLFTPGKKFDLDKKILEFNQEFTFFIRTYFFVYLGILISIKDFHLMPLVFAVDLFVIIIIMRFISVKICALLSRPIAEDFLLYFAMIPRGLALAVLAGLPAVMYQKPGSAISPQLFEEAKLFVFYAFCIIILSNLFLTVMSIYASYKTKKVSKEASS